MDRHITEMEIHVSEAIQERKQWDARIGRSLQQERQDIEKWKALCKENQDFAQQQMHWDEQERCEARKNFVESANAHDFPNFREPPEADFSKLIHTNQSKARTELDQQARTKNTLKNMARRKERMLERSQLDANRVEMQMPRGEELAKRHHEKEVLSTVCRPAGTGRSAWRTSGARARIARTPPSRKPRFSAVKRTTRPREDRACHPGSWPDPAVARRSLSR